MIYVCNLLICSVIIGVISNVLFHWLFVKLNKFDSINPRSSHSTLATKTGGIALFTTLFFITLYFYFTNNEIFDFSLLIPLALIFIIGVYDDFYDANFKLKFFIQIIIAKLLIDNGFIINNYYGLFGLYEIPYLIAQFTTVFVFVVLVNAFNFIDGIDGLAVSFAIFSILGFEYLNESSLLTLLNTICIGGLIPLYYFNFKKENKIFLGDAGSLFLGSLIAINLFHYLDIDQRVLNGNRVLLSVAVLFYPLIDLLRVFIIRINQKKSPFVADKNHIHHIIQDKVKNHFLTSSLILISSLMILIMSYMISNKF
jgi:UDP-N-acetylmuramyl pentapeptide phosphotransferase/UDP-N-acetylglucosamine-1-phosphate transferase